MLAVIVILAVIALITTPIILNMISTAKKGAAKSSALGYIDAVEKEAMMNQLDPLKENIKDGTYFVEDLKASYKGVGPDEGLVIIKNGKVEEAKLCINKYSVYYKDSKAEIATNNYCSEEFKVILNIGDNKKEQTIKKVTETTFDINGIDISNKTNMSCNNGSIPSIENNTFKVSNIFGNTTCYINDTLEETVGNLDSSMTNIIMLKDETLNNTLTIKEDKNVILDLNNKTISSSVDTIKNLGELTIENSGVITTTGLNTKVLYNYGKSSLLTINNGYIKGTSNCDSWYCSPIYSIKSSNLIVNSKNETKFDENDKYLDGVYVESTHGIVVWVASNSTGEINGGIYKAIQNSDNRSWQALVCSSCNILNINNATTAMGDGASIRNQGTGIINVKNGEFTSSYYNVVSDGESSGVINIYGGNFYSSDNVNVNHSGTGTVNIYGGKFISENHYSIYSNSSSTLNIKQTDKPIYISSLAKAWRPAIKNNSDGTINISGNKANECTSDPTKTTSGLCVYAEGNKDYESTTSNCAISNEGNGIININGGTYFGGFMGVSDHYGGVTNILNGKICSGNRSIDVTRNSTINVCGGTISSLKYDLWTETVTTTGTINYSNSVIFTNGNNKPIIGGPLASTNIIGNYQGTCTSK